MKSRREILEEGKTKGEFSCQNDIDNLNYILYRE